MCVCAWVMCGCGLNEGVCDEQADPDENVLRTTKVGEDVKYDECTAYDRERPRGQKYIV